MDTGVCGRCIPLVLAKNVKSSGYSHSYLTSLATFPRPVCLLLHVFVTVTIADHTRD